MSVLKKINSLNTTNKPFTPIKTGLKIAVSAALSMSALTANAALERIVYTNNQGDETTLTRPTQMFARANQSLEAVISAGLDRRVKLSLYDAIDNAILEEKVSHLLTVEDKISFGGVDDEMYAAIMNINTPNKDGRYHLVARTLGYGDTILSEESMDITIDGEAPKIGGHIYNTEMHSDYGNVTEKPIGIITHDYTKIIAVDNVSDNMGITKATLNIYHDEGANKGKLVSTTQATYDATNEQITFNGLGQWAKLFKNQTGVYKIEFVAEDAAGNTSNVNHQIFYSYSCPAFKPEPVAVYTPGHTGNYIGEVGYKAWTEGGVLPQNPPQLIWRVPLSQMWPTNFEGYQNVPFKTDANYAYFKSNVPFNNGLRGDAHQGGFSTKSHWRCHLFSEVKGSLAPGLTQTPKKAGTVLTRGEKPEQTPYAGVFIANKPYSQYSSRVSVEPRNYEQTIENLTTKQTCKIPSGGTYCDLFFDRNSQPHNVYLPQALYGYPTTHPSLRVHMGHSSVTTDFKPVEIRGLTYDKYTQKIQVSIYDPDSDEGERSGNSGTMWLPNSATLQLKNIDEGSVRATQINGYNNFERVNRNNFIAHFDISGYPEGRYTLQDLSVKDVAGNTAHAKLLPSNQPPTSPGQYIYIVDKTAPKIQPIYRTLDGSKIVGKNEVVTINSLDQLVYEITDNSEVTVNSIRIQYLRKATNPEELDYKDGVYVGHRKEGNTYYLEYPLMSPTLEENESYNITINVVDEYGNESELVTTVKYEPRVIHLTSGVSGKLYIPAVMSEFYHSNGTRAISTEPLLLSDGSPLQGRYDVVVSMRDDSEIPLYINNQLVVPSQELTIIRNFDFSANGSRLAIPVHAAENGLLGTAKLMMTTTAPNSPVLMIDVVTWNGNAVLKSNTWEFRQVIDEFDITAMPDQDSICRVTSSEAEARASDPIKDPVCLLEWTQFPPESSPKQSDSRNGMQTLAGLTGHAVALGEQLLKYELSIFNGIGEKLFLSEGSQKINIVTALGSVGFEPAHASMEFDRSIEHVGIDFRQSFGPECKLTLDALLATRSWANKNTKERYCFFEWLDLPPGVTQDERYKFPRSKGKVAENGEHPLKWRLSIYSILGAKVPVGEQDASLTIVDPVTPTFVMDSEHRITEGEDVFVVPMKASTLGTLYATIGNGDVTITTKVGSQITNRRTFVASTTGSQARTSIRSSLQFIDSKLHDKKTYTAEIAYSELPDLKATQDYVVYTIPNNTVRPEIEVNRDAVTTELLPVKMRMNDTRFSREGYNSETMGQWEARVVIPQGRDKPDLVLTDYLPMVNGEVTTELDIEQFSNLRTIQLQAEARWIHDIPKYEHVVKSRTMGRVNLQSGLPIDGEVSVKKLSGAAPFTTVFSLMLDNARDRTNIETVEWQESSDRSNWTTIPMTVQDSRKLTRTFNEGTHYIRAIVTNKFSGLQSQTEHVEIIAYQVVETEIVGSLAYFVGSDAHFKANAFIRIEPTDEQKELIKRGQLDYESVSREPIDLSKVDIQWSTDRWKTIAFEGESITISSDEPKRVNLDARIKPILAPDDDNHAYSNARATISFNNPRAPVVRINGNRNLEFGKVHTFDLNFSAPFRNLSHDIGYEVHYPNGEVATAVIPASEGDRVFRQFTYELTEEDNRAGQVSFIVNAYIVGFEEETKATATFSPKTWQYVFPNFSMHINRSTVEVPSEVNVTVSPSATFRGTLDGPKYEWNYPQHFEVIRSRNEMNRTFLIKEAGRHEVQVTVRDARGNEKVITGTIDVVEPKPFTVRLQSYPSNKYNRAPLDVRFRAFISGGHPKDRLREYNFIINGDKTLPSGDMNILGLPAGLNKITFMGKSEMGVEVEEALEIQVNANKKPVCDPVQAVRTARVISATAFCRDDDGQVTGYEWRVNGQLVDLNSRRISQRLDLDQKAPTITVQVIDDSGMKSDVYKVKTD